MVVQCQFTLRGWQFSVLHINDKIQAPNTHDYLHWTAAGGYNLMQSHELSDLVVYHGSNVGLKLRVVPMPKLESVQYRPGKFIMMGTCFPGAS